MARGDVNRVKVHFKGEDDDFLVFLDSVEDYQRWLSDRSVPLAHVVSSFKVFTTHRRGAQGIYEGASKSMLENEFGTSDENDAVLKILEKGSLQEFEV
ncbi:Restriction of telomere capping protein 3 [Madurella mycetomatis]|uniref:Restriction of telomere capping protein 3 n=1 Tax=Madurella mycetomatis TaxID=100816 RepID=A0A175VUJ9_9PEZI|nr:Restriction of telomere capping protein 3 [Madurella mycetomatis]